MRATEAKFETAKHDVVLAFNIVHGFSDEVNRKLFNAIAATLQRGGIVYVMDQLKETGRSRIDRLLPAMVGLNLLNEIGGDVYSFETIRDWCESTGLTGVMIHRLSIPGLSLVSARKV